MSHIFALAAATVFGCMFVIWSKKTWPDVLIKIVLFGMTVWGIVAFFRG